MAGLCDHLVFFLGGLRLAVESRVVTIFGCL